MKTWTWRQQAKFACCGDDAVSFLDALDLEEENYVWKIQGEDGRSKSVSRWVRMVRCTALAFCTQLQVAISVYDASNAAPCAWHAQSANAARGQVALNRWQLTACTTKRRLVSKKPQTSQIPILPTFFLPHGQALPRQSKIQTARTFGSWNVLA